MEIERYTLKKHEKGCSIGVAVVRVDANGKERTARIYGKDAHKRAMEEAAKFAPLPVKRLCEFPYFML